METIKLFSILMLGLLVFISCEKDDPEIPNEEELITTVTYTLTPASGGSAVQLVYKDLDGDGGSAPVITTGILQSGTTYSGTLELLNETETPAGNLTEEIEEEGDEHQFFFSSTTNITVAYNDGDANGKPVGLETLLTTGDAGMGKLKIVLRHQPDKNASGVSEGNISNAGGETDIEIEFDVTIQ